MKDRLSEAPKAHVFYYFYVVEQLAEQDKSIVFSVPIGNYGNLTAKQGYVANPNGHIGYRAVREYLDEHDVVGVFLETAYLVKFREDLEPVIGEKVSPPDSPRHVHDKEVKASSCNREYPEFRNLLRQLL